MLLSARRVGPTGFAYGLDMTDEMLDLARANAAKAGATNVEFVKGHIEDIPLPDGVGRCGDLQLRDQPVHRQAGGARRDVPGADPGRAARDLRCGRRGPAVARRTGPNAAPTSGASPARCPGREYLDGLAAAGFADAEVVFTHEAAPGMHGAIVRAVKPATTVRGVTR